MAPEQPNSGSPNPEGDPSDPSRRPADESNLNGPSDSSSSQLGEADVEKLLADAEQLTSQLSEQVGLEAVSEHRETDATDAAADDDADSSTENEDGGGAPAGKTDAADASDAQGDASAEERNDADVTGEESETDEAGDEAGEGDSDSEMDAGIDRHSSIDDQLAAAEKALEQVQAHVGQSPLQPKGTPVQLPPKGGGIKLPPKGAGGASGQVVLPGSKEGADQLVAGDAGEAPFDLEPGAPAPKSKRGLLAKYGSKLKKVKKRLNKILDILDKPFGFVGPGIRVLLGWLAIFFLITSLWLTVFFVF